MKFRVLRRARRGRLIIEYGRLGRLEAIRVSGPLTPMRIYPL